MSAFELPFEVWAEFCRHYRKTEGSEPNERDRFHRQLFEYFAAGWVSAKTKDKEKGGAS